MSKKPESSDPSEPQLPDWARDFPDFWHDPALLELAKGDTEHLRFLVNARLYSWRVEHYDASPEAVGQAAHKADALMAYEMTHHLRPPTEGS